MQNSNKKVFCSFPVLACDTEGCYPCIRKISKLAAAFCLFRQPKDAAYNRMHNSLPGEDVMQFCSMIPQNRGCGCRCRMFSLYMYRDNYEK